MPESLDILYGSNKQTGQLVMIRISETPYILPPAEHLSRYPARRSRPVKNLMPGLPKPGQTAAGTVSHIDGGQ